MSIEGIVYCFENLVNGKKYVGQTRTSSAKERFRAHWAGTSNTKPFNRAMKKYGTEAFMFRILEDDITTQEALDDLEIFWIKEMNSQVPNGYNVTAGGGGTAGYRHTEEARAKIGEASRGRVFSEERRRKIGEGHKGKKASPELRLKLSLAHKARAVRCVNTGQVYENASIAARSLNTCSTSIRNAIKEHWPCMGEYWMYQDDFEAGVVFQPRVNKPTGNGGKPVICIETKQRYKNMATAALEITNGRTDKSHILRAINNGSTCFGYHWMFQEDYDAGKVHVPHIKKSNGGTRRAIRCVETGKEYATVKEAVIDITNGEKQYGDFSHAIKNGKTSLGYHWEYVDKTPPLEGKDTNDRPS